MGRSGVGHRKVGLRALFMALVLTYAAFGASDADILKAIQASGLDPSQIKFKNGQGRIDVDPANKRSYYVFTPSPGDPQSPSYLIPLSTVRYTPRSYSTPEWWTANKDAIAKAREDRSPTPMQDPEEVRAFLKANGLTTNPDVFVISEGGKYRTEPLQQFLLAEYRKQGEKVKLYRGSLRPAEQGQWESGVMPWGSQYYTPSATYGWRYARKMPGAPFGELQEQGKAPLFEFVLPFTEFESMVRRGELTLGVELPKSAHDRFDSGGMFRDALYGNSPYLGDAAFGLEFEITASKPARNRLVKAYQGSVGPMVLGESAVEQLTDGVTRLKLQFPDHPEVVDLEGLLRGRPSARGFSIPSDLKSCLVRFQEMAGGEK